MQLAKIFEIENVIGQNIWNRECDGQDIWNRECDGQDIWNRECDWPRYLKPIMQLAKIFETENVIGQNIWNRELWLVKIFETENVIDQDIWNRECDWPRYLKRRMQLAETSDPAKRYPTTNSKKNALATGVTHNNIISYATI